MTLSPWKFLRTAALAAAITGVMILTRGLGLIPAGIAGVLVYAAGLFVLRIVRPRELRALRTTA
jgi:hypothetical protein